MDDIVESGSSGECDYQTWKDRFKPPVRPKERALHAQPGATNWPVPTPAERHRYLQIVDREEVEDAARAHKDTVREPERRAALDRIVCHLRSAGAFRLLPPIRIDWRLSLDRLERLYPNFSDYLGYLRAVFALSECERQAPHFEPVVFAGDPGIGKSLMAQEIATLIGSGCSTIRMETAQTSAELVGSAEFWSNSRPGRLLDAIVFGDHAAPVFVLEELEKSSAREYDPIAPLYGLLEPDSARSFYDLSHPWLRMNTSAVVWIACCNRVDTLPAPILSRMKVFDIPAPTFEQSVAIARVLWARLCKEWPHATGKIQLTEDALHAVAVQPPRLMRKVLWEAVGRALFAGRDRIRAKDIAACLARTESPRRLGFL